MVDAYNKKHPVRVDTATKYLQGKDIATTVWRTDTLLHYRTDTVTGLTITDTVFTKGKDIRYLRVDTAVITITQSERITKLENENVQLVQEKDHALLKAAQNKTWLWAFIIACISAALLLTALLIKIFKK